jgi:hypothetical protein
MAQSDGVAAAVSPRRAFQKSPVQITKRLLLAGTRNIYTRVVVTCLTGPPPFMANLTNIPFAAYP